MFFPQTFWSQQYRNVFFLLMIMNLELNVRKRLKEYGWQSFFCKGQTNTYFYNKHTPPPFQPGRHRFKAIRLTLLTWAHWSWVMYV